MRAKTRLFWCSVIIVGSFFYGGLILYNPRIASAIMLGYIGALLTIFIVVEVWKGPHGK